MRYWNIFFGSSSVATGDTAYLLAPNSRSRLPEHGLFATDLTTQTSQHKLSMTATFKSLSAAKKSNLQTNHAPQPNPRNNSAPSPTPHPYFQFGNGRAEDFQADTLNSRTNLFLRKSCSSILSRASASQSYHPGGICP